MKKIFKIIKKILFSFFILYTYNMIAVSFNLIIPINIFTIIFITILDIPGLLLLVIILKLFFWGW